MTERSETKPSSDAVASRCSHGGEEPMAIAARSHDSAHYVVVTIHDADEFDHFLDVVRTVYGYKADVVTAHAVGIKGENTK